MGEMGNAYKILLKKPDANRSLGRFRRRWDTIKTDIKEIGCEDWIHLAQGRSSCELLCTQ
jgi:hypothetical protein